MARRVQASKTDVAGCEGAVTCKIGGKSFRMCQRKRGCKIERLEYARTWQVADSGYVGRQAGKQRAGSKRASGQAVERQAGRGQIHRQANKR